MSRMNPGLACALALAVTASAQAQGEVCEAPREVDRYQLLRRLSLDLRGHVPTYEEYLALDALPDVPAEKVGELLASDAFRLQMRRYHESFLWPNVSNVSMADFNYQISPRGPAQALAHAGGTWVRNYRGEINTYCADVEQTEFDPAFPGQFRPVVTPNADGLRIEGWRMVAPYWDPQNPVKVCAYDAQETPSVVVNGRTFDCSNRTGVNRIECGCGPDLRWCSRSTAEAVVRASFREQLGLSVDEVTAGRAPYTDLLLSKKAKENGAIAYYNRHLGGLTSPSQIFQQPDSENPLADRAFTEDAWVVRDRGGLHAGILTLPGYLLRFQTQRSRANRLLVGFACEPFVAPTDLHTRPGCSQDSDDLTQRCSCQSCHASLEPVASAWSLFSEAGTTMMTDPARFPPERPDCVGKTDAFCRKFYVTNKESPAKGKHVAYEFALMHPDYEDIIHGGPVGAAQALIHDGTLARCTVKRLFSHLMKRDLLLEGKDAPERALLEELAEGFESSNYDFPALVERLVTLPEYRRVR